MGSIQHTDRRNSPTLSLPLPTPEERQAALAELGEYCKGRFPPGSLTSQYIAEREALRDIYPGTLHDLARDGIIKLYEPSSEIASENWESDL
ncbi:MAG: hypothetical protein F4X48_02240 [Acidimicrobiia bacterium]|nr:hypothetical protein [Acidimicrobiia bacterium]MYC57400.1 hypothetical protein [Acidimicrobiia bacterium]MYI30238.1 hypothetical protein [Acidimicrobiia bacterium]